MRNILFSILILTSQLTSAQQNVVELSLKPGFTSAFTKVIYDGNGGWIAGGNHHYSYYGPLEFLTIPYLTRLDLSGGEIWKNDIRFHADFSGQVFPAAREFYTIDDMIITSDSNILRSGEARQCDYFWPYMQGGYIQKVNRDGEIIWTGKISAESIPYGLHSLVELPNGFIAVGDNKLHYFGPFGDSLQVIPLNFGEIHDLALSSQGYLMMASEYGVIKLTSGGVPVDSVPFTNSTQLYEDFDNTWVILNGLTTERLDANLVPLGQYSLSGEFSEIRDMKYHYGGYFCAGKESGSGKSVIVEYDYQFTVLNSWKFHGATTINSIAVSPDQVIMAGTDSTNMMARSFNRMGQSTEYYFDAGITDLRLNHIAWYPEPGAPPNIKGYEMNLFVTIKNFGSDTINSINVEARLHHLKSCGTNEMYRKLNQISIPPGGSMEFDLGIFADKIFTNNFDICLYSSGPQERVDIDPSNNRLCKSFTVDIPENQKRQVKIYPVPAERLLTIESENDNGNFEIYDLQGRMICRSTLIGTITNTNLEGYSPGIYIIKILSGDSVNVIKFQKL